jgi:hypothetical protein
MGVELSNTALRHLLLDMLASTPGPAPERFALVGGDEWDGLAQMARQHRLGPMLWHRSQSAAPLWPLPQNIAADWNAAYRHSALRSLVARRLLQLAETMLGPAGIRYAALKGAYLVQHAYPHPALRPLRDVDLLVEPGRAIEAYHLFRRHGFLPVEDRDIDLELELKNFKHLPALYMPGGERAAGMCVEIHGRIVHAVPRTIVPGSLHDVGALLQRAITLGSTPFLSPTDTLLHLMIHSMEDHEFNNGPLILNDVVQLLATASIDWPRFWDMADAGGWRRGCIMVLDMAARYHPLPDWPRPDGESERPGAAQLESAALLTLQDFGTSAAVSLQADLAQAGGKWSRLVILLRRAFPTLAILSAYAGAPRTSWRSMLRYPDWLWTRARERLFGNVSDDVGRAQQVRAWIRKDAGPTMR